MTDASISARALDTLLGDWRAGAAGGTVYRALAERVRLLVLDGRIPVGTRLPAERDLAERLRLSRTTVTAAYRALREQGLLHSVRGSGSVARLPGAPAILPAPPATDYVDFSKASPPALPWLADVAREAADDLPRHLGDAGFDPIGIPELREAIAARYTQRGLPTTPDEIMVTIGAQHAIALLSRALVGRGDRAVIEAPTYPHAYEALRVAGARLVPVPVVPHGADVGELGDTSDEGDELVQALRHANPVAAYLMPDFQNPTGRSLDERTRERVLEAAARQGTVVIADETIAELDIDRRRPLLPLAAYGPAVMIGSVGKTVWGGVRVGWIRADRPLIRRLLAVRAPGDLGTPILEQLIVARLLDRMDDVLALRRDQLRAGRDHLEARLAEQFPDWQVPHVDGGIVTWVNLGAPVSSQLALAARGQGLIVAAGPRFGIDGAFERFLRLPFCSDAATTDAAIAALARAWQALPAAPAPDPALPLAEVV
ncbi:MocR-like transcription factor YczR [Agromyces aerolatus]|uniref:MocR-like transcription factor YczR n=1 Tax=Agromyces sp. LY-1074 TaxID=3074080 RepID=UPI00285CA8ED|nr:MULTISPECIES: PLP-dependent aminotransferase family protein [unclassified Agromyces]MDR5698659.1 PLP-dependent aminotransferase family protein [Agromyces sp. LY-1074]MDR5704953.1 PLP-dependent aminotransferase family protein [Agromyces sp. LY-1358]